MLDDISIWKLAAERSNQPTAMLSLQDKFVYCNQAWCRMLGYAESELLNKRWQDVTDTQDIGGGQQESEAVKILTKSEYYDEAFYIRKDGEKLRVGLSVLRHPPIGAHIGYVVFAQPLDGSHEYQAVLKQLESFKLTVATIKVQAAEAEKKALKAEQTAAIVERNSEILDGLIGRSDIQMGDRTTISGNQNSRISNNSAKALIAIGLVLCVSLIALGAYTLGGGFSAGEGKTSIRIESTPEP